jgi:hypothetical protein
MQAEFCLWPVVILPSLFSEIVGVGGLAALSEIGRKRDRRGSGKVGRLQGGSADSRFFLCQTGGLFPTKDDDPKIGCRIVIGVASSPCLIVKTYSPVSSQNGGQRHSQKLGVRPPLSLRGETEIAGEKRLNTGRSASKSYRQKRRKTMSGG